MQQDMAENQHLGRVCVTGASGFFASWLVKRLLEKGYHVRGTVRDPENLKKTAHLVALPGAKERLELVKADLTVEGSFDDAVAGCEGVFHTASPTTFNAQDPEKEIIEPAVKGTLSLLQACVNASVRRVVITSSSSAVRFLDLDDPTPLADESCWSSLTRCRQEKRWYPISKVLSEQAAWKFAKEHNLDLVTVVPPFIIGPVLGPEATTSADLILSILKGDVSKLQYFLRTGLVHLDDVAAAHILLYEEPKAAGRYICSALFANMKEILDFMAQRYPKYNIPTQIEEGSAVFSRDMTSDKLQKLGFEYKGLGEMLDDCISSLEAKGFV